METLDGTITRVVHHKASKYNPSGTPFLIARLDSGSSIAGEMRKPVEGAAYRFWGEWEPGKNGYPPTFRFTSFEPVVERSASGAEQYLAAHVEGVGRAKASALADHFGADTLDVLRTEPDRALEVRGINERIVEAIREHFTEATLDPVAYAKVVDLLSKGGHKVPRKVVKALLRDFGSDAPRLIVENPYILCAYPGVGWKTADSFALGTAKYAANGIERQKAAIVEAITAITNEGHTFATRPEIQAAAYRLIQMEPTFEAWRLLLLDKDIEGDGTRYSTPALWHAEAYVADRLATLAAEAQPLPIALDPTGLADDQAAALATIQDNGVALLIGPPGTGKSYTVARVVKPLANAGLSVRVVAPTGKAAKRAAELLAGAGVDAEIVPSTTIHKALGTVMSSEDDAGPSQAEAKHGRGRESFGFVHGEAEPWPEDVIVVDETSMVDVRLAAALLAAVAPGSRVLFVGDENQLPSVGPGSVLRDMIRGGIPTASLTAIKRSDGGGRVVKACHAIKDGREPQPATALAPPTENWLHIEEDDPQRIADLIVDLHRQASERDPYWDFQVVSAQKGKHPFACDALNRKLSELLNPSFPPGAPIDEREPFRPGDKVIRLKNGTAETLLTVPPAGGRGDWEFQGIRYLIGEKAVIVNGDMGTVQGIQIDGDKSWVVVRFRDPYRLCRLPYGDHNLAQAYAVTVHKAQGSGFPVVIVPCHGSFFFDQRSGAGLWCRELFYTAISRAEQVLVTVGQWAAIRTAIGRQTVHRRRTRLAGLLKPEAQPAPAAAVPTFEPSFATIPAEYEV